MRWTDGHDFDAIRKAHLFPGQPHQPSRGLPLVACGRHKKQVFGNGWQTHGGYKLGELIHFRKDFEGLALITGSGSRAAVIDMDGPRSEESFAHFIGHSFGGCRNRLLVIRRPGRHSRVYLIPMNGGTDFPTEKTNTFQDAGISNCGERITTQ